MSNDAKRIIQAEYGDSSNFMTPQVLRTEIVGTLPDGHTVAVELSQGEGLVNREPIFGVSFVLERPDGTTERLHDLSGVRGSLEEAEALVEHVRDSLDGAEDLPAFFWES